MLWTPSTVDVEIHTETAVLTQAAVATRLGHYGASA
jgi:hypothetical protein